MNNLSQIEGMQHLCKDRPLLTPEIHTPNDFYGHAKILKQYVGIPIHRSLKVAIEHGIFLNDYFWEIDLKTECPVFLCATKRHAQEFERRTKGRVRAEAIGPMLRYVNKEPVEPSRSTLLVFPAHSTHRIWSRFSHDSFISRLDELRRDFDEVKVCIYWRDVQGGLHKIFTKRGFECVTAGHMYDPNFLIRLSHLICSATATMTNEVGTSILYSVLLERPVWIERGKIEYASDSAEALETDVPEFLQHPTVQKLIQVFSNASNQISSEQRDFVAEITGETFVRTPDELKSVFAEAEEMYRGRTGVVTRARHRLRSRKYFMSLICGNRLCDD